jgi:hypothetical protein
MLARDVLSTVYVARLACFCSFLEDVAHQSAHQLAHQTCTAKPLQLCPSHIAVEPSNYQGIETSCVPASFRYVLDSAVEFTNEKLVQRPWSHGIYRSQRWL